MTSNANDLTERLRRRLESERREIEELTASELERLRANSWRVANNALRTIERDTAEATGRMRALLLKTWLRPLIVGPSLWLGIFGGSWATMRWLWTRIQARIETAAVLDLDIEEARQTLAQLETDTWGIVLREIEGERFVVLPAGRSRTSQGGWARGARIVLGWLSSGVTKYRRKAASGTVWPSVRRAISALTLASPRSATPCNERAAASDS